MFPVWLKFQGGKGVATTIGVIFALSWTVGITVTTLWLVVVFLRRYSSLGAIIAIPSSPALLATLLAYQRSGDLPGWLPGEPLYVSLFGILAVLVLARHYGNIQRLLKGTEARLFARRR